LGAAFVILAGVVGAIARVDVTPAAASVPNPAGDLPEIPFLRGSVPPGTPPPATADGFGAFDTATGVWHLRTRAGEPAVFAFGAPGDVPLVGDWNGDGVATVAVYDPATRTVSLRNTNTAGAPDATFTLGEAGDVPIAGDFDGDGTDSVALFRPSTGTVLVYQHTGTGGVDLGAPDVTFAFGEAGQVPFTGDFDGDGVDTVGFYDPATGQVTLRNTLDAGPPDATFTLGVTGARPAAGDWNGDGVDTPGLFDPATATVHLLDANAAKAADESYGWGRATWSPVAGLFGLVPGAFSEQSVSVSLSGPAPEGLVWAVESLYLEYGSAPYLPQSMRRHLAGLSDGPQPLTLTGTSNVDVAFGKELGTVKIGQDVILAVSDDGWTWRVVGADLPSTGTIRSYGSGPRFVFIIGSDWQNPSTPAQIHGDSMHIYAVDPVRGRGAIVGIPRDTAVHWTGTYGYGNYKGWQKVNRILYEGSPANQTAAIAAETGLPIEGYLQTGFGKRLGGGIPGFEDLVADFLTNVLGSPDGFPFLVPYDAPAWHPPVYEGDTKVTGEEALSFARERKTRPRGDVDRTLAQGLLMKAAVGVVQSLGETAIPSLLAIMDKYVNTDLSADQLLTLAATIFTVDPGLVTPPSPPHNLTPSDLAEYLTTAYDLNPGTLPNVVVRGCSGLFDTSYAFWWVNENHATFADLADGVLDAPSYLYFSGTMPYYLRCPWDQLPQVERVAGQDRYATATAISSSVFVPLPYTDPAAVPVAYIATGTNFPDALAGAPLAAATGGPVLLTSPTSLPSTVRNELTRLNPRKIVILGGSGAVSDTVKSQLAAYTSGSVTRLWGSNRYATAVEISKAHFTPGVPVVYVATGENFPDALAGAPVAALAGGPVLLTTPTSLPSVTRSELSRLKPGKIVILGGSGAVSDTVKSQLAAYTSGSVTRLWGSNRYATAVAISKSHFSPGVPVAYIATGENFPDALAGGPLAARAGGPVLLATPTSLPSATRTELARLRPHRIVILGGSGAVSDAVKSQLAAYLVPQTSPVG